MRNRKNISSLTQLCAVIGHPLGHTLSPAIHNAGYEALELDFIYLAFDVERAESAICAMRGLTTFKGLSVTIPHKVEVMKWVDEVAEIDRRIGAINTVVKEDGRLVGFGTDGPGALKALHDSGIDPRGLNVLMLGAGGAARAIAFTLVHTAGIAAIHVLELDETVLQGLCADVAEGAAARVSGAIYSADSLAAAVARADLVINCTPVGMYPNVERSPLPPELLRKEQAVFDIVYNPLKTKLIADAARKGCRTVAGAGMFVNQAVLQFERFCGCAAPQEVMGRVVMEHLNA